MREVLLVSYYTPPRPGVASVRTQQIRTHLPSFGWRVTTVTAALDGAPEDVVQTPYADLSQLLKRTLGVGSRSTHALLGVSTPRHGERPTLRQRAIAFGYRLTGYPDQQIGWLRGGRSALGALLRARRFDAILSSAPPFTTNLMIASVRPRVPWVADFRDLWAESEAREAALQRFADGGFERWTLRSAAAATTISPEMAEVLHAHCPRLHVEAIPNAFDADEWDAIPIETEARCTIVYAGQLYHGRADPTPLFRAVRTLLDRGELAPGALRIDLYVADQAWLTAAIERFGVAEIVRVRGSVDRAAVMAAERRADRLLVFRWDGRNAHAIVPAKLFEYLGARRRIILLGGPSPSAVERILEETGAGLRCADDAQLEREIVAAVREHEAGTVRLLEREPARRYEARALGERFAALLDAVVSERMRQRMTR